MKINTHNVVSFKEKFMRPETTDESMLKADFRTFFVVKVEEMFQLMKLPIPPMRSTSHILIYITEGEAIMNIGSQTFTIHENECMIVAAGQVYSFSNPDINKGFLCYFEDLFLLNKFSAADLRQEFEFLNIWGNPSVKLGQPVATYTQQLFERILAEYTTHGLGTKPLTQAYFVALLYEIQSAYKSLNASVQNMAVGLTNRFKELLTSNIRTMHRVSEYAAALNVTPNHLNKVIKSVTGKSPTKWIDETLLLEAKMLLHQTRLSVNDVAAEIGVLDASYFSRLFRKYEGCTPLQFRKKIDGI
ncbi:AraC-type DNA-binding protein [Flexibacter flexilis DSM 6793]|uniref:AraC-type DNA-binding protein n=1 Tax=Flexibacter flexilis DSM 6793 TaxID=927664 RepID=A0A1I1NHM6_9BACT|nr:helix-turn-helix domain-containing protein [Flexibacter flexilis]SFC97139.1 AraC-type DNA-binding protein [Flexibacter flexilis DSM 6793]